MSFRVHDNCPDEGGGGCMYTVESEEYPAEEGRRCMYATDQYPAEDGGDCIAEDGSGYIADKLW